MGKVTTISWTDHTFSPWWGCQRVAPECERCYAEAFAKRTGLKWGPQAERRFFGNKHWEAPLRWNEAAAFAGVRKRVFCSSMADVFEDRDELYPWREKLWALIERTPWLDWLLLTKRPENISKMVPWPMAPPNVWLGTSGGTQKTADRNLEHLLSGIAAPVLFLSAEPLLELISVERWVLGIEPGCSKLGWVIAGAESGPKARPMDDEWVRALRNECSFADVPFFFKQRVDMRGNKLPEPELDGVVWNQFPKRSR